jgi:intracellular sulfur oxidation DsrE/DsrF family protein
MHTGLMNRFLHHFTIALLVTGLSVTSSGIFAETASPYGKAGEDSRNYSIINTVFDVYCRKPGQLTDIFDDLETIGATLKGRIIVVVRGAGVVVFARKNYELYAETVDHLARLARQGVQFRLDKPALRAAGFEPADLHGFATVVSSGLAEIAAAQDQGSRYLRFSPRRSLVNAKQKTGEAGSGELQDPDPEEDDGEPRFRFSM